jgi:hypothetical protein
MNVISNDSTVKLSDRIRRRRANNLKSKLHENKKIKFSLAQVFYLILTNIELVKS